MNHTKWIGISFFLFSLVVLSDKQCSTEKPTGNNKLNIQAKSASRQLDFSVSPHQLGKIDSKNKFIGIVPRNLGSKSQLIELYVIDQPTFSFDEFTLENIKRHKLTPKRLTSFSQLAGELNGFHVGFDNFSARKVETSVKGGKLTVKDLDTNSEMQCTCPCKATFGDGVTYSCD